MKRIPFLITMLLIVCLPIAGQTGKSHKVSKTELIKLSNEFGIVSTLNSAVCPVKLENAELFAYPDGNESVLNFTIRNTAKKAISYVEVTFFEKAYFSRNGNAKLRSETFKCGDASRKEKPFLPSNSILARVSKNDYQTIPISEKLLAILSDVKDKPKIKLFSIGIVNKVIYADGTIFDATKAANDIQDLFTYFEGDDFNIEIKK